MIDMAECECLATCPFFNDQMISMPAMAELQKNRYCLGDWGACARHMVFAEFGREAVPTDLFPNERERAERILTGVPSP